MSHARVIGFLKLASLDIGTSSLPFDVLKLVFVDRVGAQIKALGCTEDRLFQVEARIPNGEIVDIGNASASIIFIAQQARDAAA